MEREKRRSFLKLIGMSSGIILAPTSIIGSEKKEDKLEQLLGHSLDIKPKKIITSLHENKVVTLTDSESKYVKIIKTPLKNNFHILKRVAHKTDRKIHMYNQHTGETINLVFWSEGKYIKENLKKIDYFMRDHRENKIKRMDITVLNELNEISKHTKKNTALVFNSGYRSEHTNKKVGGVKRSQHLLGKAVDFSRDKKDHISLYALKRFLVNNHNGGVGYYPRHNFIHIDAGNKRTWRG